MGPSLAVALFILCADGQVFDQWSTIDDALECMGHAETAVQPAPLTGNVNNHSALGTAPQRRHKRSMHDGVKNGHAEQNEMTVPEEAAGQGRKRKQPAQQALSQTSVHGSLGQEGQTVNSLQQCSANKQAHAEKAWQPSIVVLGKASKSLISTKMAACIRTAVDKRLSLYRQTSLQADLFQLQEAEQLCSKLAYRDEHWKAVVSALRLVVQEKQILLDAQAALQSF